MRFSLLFPPRSAVAESVSVSEMNWRLEEESGNKTHYFLSVRIRLNIGEASVEGVYDGWVVFIKD